jgi:sugar/nucleoside kinase (ribokinase family)
VRLVGAVGEDFQAAWVELLRGREVDTRGLHVVKGGKTFRWCGEYHLDMNRRDTLSVELNVIADFKPVVPLEFRDSRYVFLANSPPETQLSVLEQVRSPRFVMADTMDLWIQTQHRQLLDLLGRVHALCLNDSEAVLLSDRHNVIDAGKAILDLGPQLVVVKKGEHGALLFTHEEILPLPAYPVSDLWDPTGAGDSFAGAFMGSLAKDERTDAAAIKRAAAYGNVAASFTVEDFGTRRLADLSRDLLSRRFDDYCRLLRV